MQTLSASDDYAGFGSRLAAWVIDSFMIYAPLITVYFLVALIFALVSDRFVNVLIEYGFIIAFALIPGLYGGFFESSALQATPGKILMRIRVTDMNGQRCTFARAFARWMGFAFSDFSFFLGYLMSLWTGKKQCLHDIAANCLIVKTRK